MRRPGSDLRLVTVDPGDLEALRPWVDNATTTFQSPRATPEQVAWRQERFADQRLWAVRDGEATVATFRSFDSHLDVPGGRVSANAISSVTVLATHRRRGLLSRWMAEELPRAAAAGDPVSILIASEAPIYGRYGFGVATSACTWELDARAASFRGPRAGTVEVVGSQTFAEHAPAAYERARVRHPGAIDRSALWWDVASHVRPGPDEPDRRRVWVLHRDADGVVDGALFYSVKPVWEERVSRSVLEVGSLVAATDGAYADLWRYCAEVDFVTAVRAEDRSPDEPLPWLLSDPRAARSGPVSDFLWVRLHDVPAALTARRYPLPGRLVLHVDDDLPAATVEGRGAGRWLLEVAADGTASCTPTDDAADLRLGVDALASLWLGGVRPDVLARSGGLAGDAAAVARAGALFSWPDPAFCGTWF